MPGTRTRRDVQAPCVQLTHGPEAAAMIYDAMTQGTGMGEDGPTPTMLDLAVMLARLEGRVAQALEGQARNEADIKDLQRAQAAHTEQIATLRSDVNALDKATAPPAKVNGWAIVATVVPTIGLLLVLAEQLYGK